MCHIFWLIVGCVEVVHSAYEACIHNCEVLIGECHIDDELRLVTVEELYELGNAAVACGFCLCKNMCRIVTSSSQRVPLVELASDLLRVLLLIVLPLTVLAAVMERYVTPVVMGLFL